MPDLTPLRTACLWVLGMALVLILVHGIVLVVRPTRTLETTLFLLYWPLLVLTHVGIMTIQVLPRTEEEGRLMDGNDDEYLPDWDFQSIYGREALAARRQVMPRRRERRGSRVPRHVCALWHGAVTRFHDCGFLLSPICGITSPTGFSHSHTVLCTPPRRREGGR